MLLQSELPRTTMADQEDSLTSISPMPMVLRKPSKSLVLNLMEEPLRLTSAVPKDPVDSEVAEVAPEVAPEVATEVDPEVVPEVATEVDPEKVDSVDPEKVDSVDPEKVATEVDPEKVDSVDPEKVVPPETTIKYED